MQRLFGQQPLIDLVAESADFPQHLACDPVLVLAENGSTDSTVALAESLCEENEHLSYFSTGEPGNGNYGIVLSDSGTTSNLIQGNFMGTEAAGTSPLPNAFAGVLLNLGAEGNAFLENVISGNAGGAMW